MNNVHVAHIVLMCEKEGKFEAFEELKDVCTNKLPENHFSYLLNLYNNVLPVAQSGKLIVTKMKANYDGLSLFEKTFLRVDTGF